ncbi:MAG: hypothetical protein ACRECF_00760 [Methyloceanibacter sp.]
MGSITTAPTTRFKKGLMSAEYCLNPDTDFTADTTTGSATLTNVSSLAGLAVGMRVVGSGIPMNTMIARILSDTSIRLSEEATATAATVDLLGEADQINFALIKAAPTGDYGEDTESYNELTGNADETAGTGYTAGGFALTNVGPTLSGAVALADFSPDPSWTDASFSTQGALIYDDRRRGPIAMPAISVHSFGGAQTVTAGTLTIVLPVPSAEAAILRIQ